MPPAPRSSLLDKLCPAQLEAAVELEAAHFKLLPDGNCHEWHWLDDDVAHEEVGALDAELVRNLVRPRRRTGANTPGRGQAFFFAPSREPGVSSRTDL